MGIDLELHASRPAHKNWRPTLLRSSYGHGDALADALGSLQLLGVPGRPTAVDPYGDTLMNEQEAAAAVLEIDALKQWCGDERQLAGRPARPLPAQAGDSSPRSPDPLPRPRHSPATERCQRAGR